MHLPFRKINGVSCSADKLIWEDQQRAKLCQHSLRAGEKQIDYSGYLHPTPPYPFHFSILIQFDVCISEETDKEASL